MSIPIRHLGSREITTEYVHGPSGTTPLVRPGPGLYLLPGPHVLSILIEAPRVEFCVPVSMSVPTILEKSAQSHFSTAPLPK